MGFWDKLGYGLQEYLPLPGGHTSIYGRAVENYFKEDPREAEKRAQLSGEAGAASGFAGQGEEQFGAHGQRMDRNLGALEAVARGKHSFSAEQLRQGNQQAMAQQQAMAAGASPANQAMAARNMMMNQGRISQGLAGQQALAGIAERQAASQALIQGLGQMRQQDLMAATDSRRNAITGYGGTGDTGPSGTQKAMEAIKTGATLYAMSDKRLKTSIKSADKDANALVEGLKAYTFKYKNAKHGEGEQLGIMAQDLEATKLGKQAVIDTPEGKAVHGTKLATALAAGLSAMSRRVKKLEGKGK